MNNFLDAILVKIVFLGMVDKALLLINIQSNNLDTVVKLFQIVFYGLGAFVLSTSAYEWNVKRRRYNKWVERGCKAEEMNQYGIK